MERDYEETYQTKNKDGRSVSKTRRSSETVSNQEHNTPFYLRDETGRVRINPQQAEIKLKQVVDVYEPATNVNIREGALSWKGLSFTPGNSFMTNRGGRKTLGYRFREEIFPLNQYVTVIGEASDKQKELTVAKPDQGILIISEKLAETLVADAEKKSKMLRTVTLVCLIAGAVLTLAGFFV